MRRVLALTILLALTVAHVGPAQAAHAPEPGSDPASGSRMVLPSGSSDNRATITFSYYVGYPQLTQASCSLKLPRGSNGIEVLEVAVDQGCIESFSTEKRSRIEMLHCIDLFCSGVTNSRGIVPDTAWSVDWTGEKTVYPSQSDYTRRGLKGYSASDGDEFHCELTLVN